MNLNAKTKKKGIALKAEVNCLESVSYTKKEKMMSTLNFGKLLQKSGKTSRTQNFIKGERRDKRNDNKQRTKRRVERKPFKPKQKRERYQVQRM